MTKRFGALIYATIIGLLIVAIFLGFLSGLDNPIAWLLIVVLLLIPFVYNKTTALKQLAWKDEYSVGVRILDDDHKKLINMLNQFTTAYDYHTSEQFEKQVLNDLVDYTKFHFAREEKLMADAGYPDLENHKKQHELMIAEVDRFVIKYNQEGHDALAEVSEFLTNWLINHIKGNDKEYGPYLNEKGIK